MPFAARGLVVIYPKVSKRFGAHRRLGQFASSLAAAAALFAISGAAHASATLVQNTSATGSAVLVTTTASPSWGSATVAGHLLVAIVTYNGSPTLTMPSGWTAATTASEGLNVSVAIYYIQNASSQSGAQTFTATGSSSAPGLSVQLAEYAGVVASSAEDVSGSATSTSANSVTVSTSTATTAGPELAIVAFAEDNTGASHAWGNPPSPFTDINTSDVTSTATREHGAYDSSVSTGTTVSEKLSLGNNKTANMAAAIATFKVAVTTYYWVGTGTYGARGGATCSGYFDDGHCWSTTSGGTPGSTAPASSDAVVFDGAAGTTDGNCTIDPSPSNPTKVDSITMTSGYTGTVTHNTQTIVLNGALAVGGGTFKTSSTSTNTISTDQALAGTYNGNLVVQGGTFTGQGAAIKVRALSVSSGTYTQASSALTTSSGAAFSGGMATTGTGTVTLGTPLTVSGGTVTFGTGPISVAGMVTVSSGALTFTDGASNPDFSTTGVFLQSGGTVNMSASQISLGTGVAAGSDAFTMTGGTFNAGTGIFTSGTAGQTTTISGPSAMFNGASGTENFGGPLDITSGALNTGTASMSTSRNGTNGDVDKLVTIASSGVMTLGAGGFAFASANSTMTIAGTLNAGSGTVTFSGPVALSGTFNANTSTTTLSGAVTMTGTSTFNGNTGTTTVAVAPTLTAGTFTVGDAGSTGEVIASLGATFASGMTLAFPTSGGTLAAPGGQTIAINGTVTSSAGNTSTPPKIARSTGTTGITIAFGSTSVLSVNGLEFDNSVAGGVTIADGATYTLLEKLAFKNNVANSISTGATHLSITKSNSVITVPGCSFDATAQYNVTLSGVSGSAGVRAIFEFQNSTFNGLRGGHLYDLDADTYDDNVADSIVSPRFGSVVEWVAAEPVDTSGAAAGYPTAAFDWNTFQFYGIYVAYNNATASTDTLWLRNGDGSAAYSFSLSSATDGSIVGTPWWDTVNETTAGVDANGNGNQTDTDVRVVYIGTSTGHIIKLVDSGTSLARPAAGPWSTDFTSSSVATISSPLIEDGTNLYFGGTDGSTATKIFGVQVAGGANEKTLQKNIGSVSVVTACPSSTVYSGSTYAFLGSTATSSQAYVYRVNMTAGAIDASFSGVTTNINDSVRLINNRAYAVTDGGTMHVLNASSFTTGGFTNVTGFPYQSTAAQPIKAAPYVDYQTNNAYFGDTGGNLYVVTSTGGNLTGYPFSISASIQLASSPVYLPGGGVIVVGANDGYVYFIDRHNTSNVPAIFKRYFVTAAGTVSTVAYDYQTSRYMVSTSDGKLAFINASDVPDPTSGTE